MALVESQKIMRTQHDGRSDVKQVAGTGTDLGQVCFAQAFRLAECIGPDQRRVLKYSFSEVGVATSENGAEIDWRKALLKNADSNRGPEFQTMEWSKCKPSIALAMHCRACAECGSGVYNGIRKLASG